MGTVVRHRVVLVEIERDDAREVDVTGLMASDQLLVNADRGAPGGQAEDGPALGPDLPMNDLDDAFGDEGGEVFMLGEDDGAEALTVAGAFNGGERRSPRGGLHTLTSIIAPRL